MRYARPILLSLICSIFLLTYLPVFADTNKTNLINNLIPETTAEGEKISILFDHEFNEPISPHFDDGIVRLTLPNTDYSRDIEYNHINDRFVRFVRLFREGKSTIVEVLFADNSFQAVGKVRTEKADNRIDFFIYKEEFIAELNNKEEKPSEELVDKFEPMPLSGQFLENSSITTNIIKMLLALTAVLAFFYLLLWFYNRFFVSKFKYRKGNHSIKLVSSYHINPKQKIVILDVNNTEFACGVTSNSISLISKLEDDSFAGYLSGLDSSQKGEINFSNLRAEYLASKEVLSNAEEPKKKRTFADELISRVKQLRPID